MGEKTQHDSFGISWRLIFKYVFLLPWPFISHRHLFWWYIAKSCNLFPLVEFRGNRVAFSYYYINHLFLPQQRKLKKLKIDETSCPGNEQQTRFQLISNSVPVIFPQGLRTIDTRLKVHLYFNHLMLPSAQSKPWLKTAQAGYALHILWKKIWGWGET